LATTEPRRLSLAFDSNSPPLLAHRLIGRTQDPNPGYPTPIDPPLSKSKPPHIVRKNRAHDTQFSIFSPKPLPLARTHDLNPGLALSNRRPTIQIQAPRTSFAKNRAHSAQFSIFSPKPPPLARRWIVRTQDPTPAYPSPIDPPTVQIQAPRTSFTKTEPTTLGFDFQPKAPSPSPSRAAGSRGPTTQTLAYPSTINLHYPNPSPPIHRSQKPTPSAQFSILAQNPLPFARRWIMQTQDPNSGLPLPNRTPTIQIQASPHIIRKKPSPRHSVFDFQPKAPSPLARRWITRTQTPAYPSPIDPPLSKSKPPAHHSQKLSPRRRFSIFSPKPLPLARAGSHRPTTPCYPNPSSPAHRFAKTEPPPLSSRFFSPKPLPLPRPHH